MDPMGERGDTANAAIHALFERSGTSRRIEARTALFLEADRADAVYLVSSGLIRIDKTTADGRVVLLDLAGPADLIGELGAIRSQPRSAAAWAVRDSLVHQMPASEFVTALRANAGLAIDVLSSTADRLGELTFQLVEASTYSAPARVAARILRLLDMAEIDLRHPGEIDLRLPITQQDLADWSGLRREGVVIGLKSLRELGIVETGRMRITIIDLPALQRLAR